MSWDRDTEVGQDREIDRDVGREVGEGEEKNQKSIEVKGKRTLSVGIGRTEKAKKRGDAAESSLVPLSALAPYRINLAVQASDT